jgi:hypothetical protein
MSRTMIKFANLIQVYVIGLTWLLGYEILLSFSKSMIAINAKTTSDQRAKLTMQKLNSRETIIDLSTH